jgi:Cysteine rich repeat
MLRTTLAVGVALLLLGSIATAQNRAAVKACAADIETHCGKFRPGSGAIKECMKTHLRDFSQPCQAAMLQAKAVAKECAVDLKQNCAGVKPGGSRIEACLHAHLSSLSDGCKGAISGTPHG